MIVKYLAIGVILYLIYIFFFRAKRSERVDKTNKDKNAKDTETMVECAKCSTFISPNEAIIKSGKYYCSKECAGV